MNRKNEATISFPWPHHFVMILHIILIIILKGGSVAAAVLLAFWVLGSADHGFAPKVALDGAKALYDAKHELALELPRSAAVAVSVTTRPWAQFEPVPVHEEKVECRWTLQRTRLLPLSAKLSTAVAYKGRGPPSFSVKLLVEDTLFVRWRWNASAQWGSPFATLAQRDHGFAAELLYAGAALPLSFGAQLHGKITVARHGRVDARSALAGPSVQWQPTAAARVHLSLLLGGMERCGRGAVVPLAAAFIVVNATGP